MAKNYNIQWYKNEKYGTPITRTTAVETIDAKTAVDIFTKNCGNLKKVTIVSIQEFNENGNVGEPILPVDGTSIVPTAHK